MPWQDRVRPCVYESPSGVRVPLLFEDVSYSFERKTTAFEFPDTDGTFVQDLGRTGRRIPLRVYISGDDYDLQAAVFDAALSERGIGRLEHPTYGVVNVVPAGTIARRDDLKSGGNQAVYEIDFFETNDLLFPTSSFSPGAAVVEALESAAVVVPESFASEIEMDSTAESISLRDRFRSVLGRVKTGLDAVADQQANVKQAYDTVFESINSGIDTFIADPLTLAFQAQVLAKLPARAAALISDRLDAYGDLIASLTTGGVVYTPSNDAQPANAYRNDSLWASGLVLGAVVAVLDNQFELKPNAIAAAETLLGFCDQLTAWQDDNAQSLGLIDTGESYQQVEKACGLAAGFLVDLSFSLRPERSIVTVRARTPIDLEAELYGTVDDNLDFLITSNSFSGDEILEVPAGRTVVYYVD